jgi:serine/threonine-protein kinase ULK/ATG1
MSKKRETQHKIVENYKLYEEIGAGQYGKVFRAIDTKTGETVAVKVIPLEKFAHVPKLEEFTANEIKTLGRINNPNVIKFIEMLKTTNNMYLVYEFCEGGTLERLLQQKHHFTELEAMKWFGQIMNAFKALYKENILHRDLKPSNILLHKDILKIADFGFCKRLMSPYELTLTMVGSPIYMAPEILKGQPYTIKADVWSLGVVLYELLFGICPYEDQTLAGLIGQIDNNPVILRKEINNISLNTENLVKKMLIKDSKARMEWIELLEWPLKIEELEASALKPSATGMRLDLDTVNKFNDAGNQRKEEEKKIFGTLLRERSKVLFLVENLVSTLEYNLNSKAPLLALMLIKKINLLVEALKKEISIENSNSKYANLPSWNSFRSAEAYVTFSTRLNGEYDEIIKTLGMFKGDVQNMITANPLDPELNDQTFKIEMMDTFVNYSYFHKLLIHYAEDLNETIQSKLKLKQDDLAQKYMIHGLNLLECETIDEFFEAHIEQGSITATLQEQSYFRALSASNKEKLQEILATKLNTVKLTKY